MIKINLAARKTSTTMSRSESTGITFVGGYLQNLLSRNSSGGGQGMGGILATEGLNRFVVVLAIYAGIYFAARYLINQYQEGLLSEVRAEVSQLNTTIQGLDQELAKSEGYEAAKKRLENDEKMLRNKINTIQKLVNDRNTSSKILVALSQAIPAQVWLKDFSLKEGAFQMTGEALGMEVVSDFIKALEGSIYFKEVTLKNSTQTGASDSSSHRVSTTSFQLEAKLR